MHTDHGLALDPQITTGGRLKTGNHPQKGCFAATGRAKNGKEGPLRDVKADTIYSFEITEVLYQIAAFQIGVRVSQIVTS